MNMFKAVKATSVNEYLASVPDERRDAINFLHEFIQKNAPSLKPHYAYNMLGYGSFKYKNSKKEDMDWPTVAMASQKNYTSIYICAVVDGQYVAEKFKDQLGNVSVGRSCIRFKKLEDLNIDVLQKIIVQSEKTPGLVGAGEHKTKK